LVDGKDSHGPDGRAQGESKSVAEAPSCPEPEAPLADVPPGHPSETPPEHPERVAADQPATTVSEAVGGAPATPFDGQEPGSIEVPDPNASAGDVPSGGGELAAPDGRTAVEPSLKSQAQASSNEPRTLAGAVRTFRKTAQDVISAVRERYEPYRPRLWKAARYAAYGAVGYLALVLVLIVVYRFANPPGSTLMLIRALGGTSIKKTWVPLERISPNLIRAVVVAEDGQFCHHRGVDLGAIREALERAGRAGNGTPRGASTISMQLTKNLFLWPSKSYVRKAIEIPLTLVMEVVWPKWRILEIYLNVVEWGPGIFGAGAAARHHFKKPASRLSERQAALLAAALPNPAVRNAGRPGPRTRRKARVVQARMRAARRIAACVRNR
jgi:monofunctional glycosyltransferase